MKNKRDNVNFIHGIVSDKHHTEEFLGHTVTVNYAFQMYFGETKISAKYKGEQGLVLVKGYGLIVQRTVQFPDVITDEMVIKLKEKGYRLVDGLYIVMLEKDFGFLTPKNYELNYLVQNLSRRDSIEDLTELGRLIRSEVANWGEQVVDMNGRLVIDNEFRVVKRDPFAKAARLALKKKLGLHGRNVVRSIQNFLDDITKIDNGGNGPGVGM